MTTPTWDEYLVEMANYVVAIRRGTQLGSTSIIEVPARPTDPIPEDYRDEAARLGDACDQLMEEVSARMVAISARPAPSLNNPHQEPPMANFLETDM